MKWNKRENFRQTVRNYENNNVNISYFVLVDYVYIIVIIVKYSIRKYLYTTTDYPLYMRLFWSSTCALKTYV